MKHKPRFSIQGSDKGAGPDPPHMNMKTAFTYQIAACVRQERKLNAILEELHSVSVTALDRDFVRSNYAKYDAQLKQVQAEKARLEKMEQELKRRY